MILLSILGEAWRAMAMNRLRAGLTMLGMIIGVASVVLMLAIGQGAQYMVGQSIASMGSNLFIILSGATTSGGLRSGAGSAPTLTLDDARAIAKLPTMKAVAPMFPGSAQIIHGSNNWSTVVNGTTPDYLEIRNWAMASGQPFTRSDVRAAARVAILGQTVARNLFGDADPVGKSVRIKNSPYLVVGLLAAKGQSLDGRDQDDRVLVPVTTAQNKLFGNPFPGTVRFIMAQAKSASVMGEAQQDITDLLHTRHHIEHGMENDFSVRNLTALAQSAASATRVLSLLLGAIASISLIVGGIGIMNIMLVSVTERTREIGIRMAVGARRRDILLQFLVEALMICIIGGLLGVFLGIAGAWLVSALVSMTVVVTLGTIGVAFLFATAIGIFFGYYPARKAAWLKPVEALRWE